MERYFFRDTQTGEVVGVFPSKSAAIVCATDAHAPGHLALYRMRTGDDAATKNGSIQQVTVGAAA